MNWLKKFWIVFTSFLPLTAEALPALLVGGGVVTAGLVGYSVYRSVSPVNLADALSFFSTCWSCQLFSDIMTQMSGILPMTYKYLGEVMIPFALVITGIWFAWQILTIYVGTKDGTFDVWGMGGKFGTHIVKVLTLCALLSVPLPRMISSVVIEPVFNLGLSMNYSLSETESRQNYANCIIVTAIADSNSIRNAKDTDVNAFSPRFRHNLTCQIANIHQITGLGMTVGWTMMNAAFEYEHMHKILWRVPLFPNIVLLFGGLLVLLLYFAALLPIPLYFLEIFVKLSIDLILLPLTLLGWVFNGWKVFPSGKGNIKQIIDDVISGTLGLALTGIFIIFSIKFLDRVFSDWNGAQIVQQAIESNDSEMLIDSLIATSQHTPLVMIILMGIFMAMFMLMIPALIKSLFNVNISDKYYESAKQEVKNVWGGIKKFWKSAKK